MDNKFFTELTRSLNQQSIWTAGVEHGRLRILLDEQPAIFVEPSGMICIHSDYAQSKECSELYHKVAPISETVLEYTTLM